MDVSVVAIPSGEEDQVIEQYTDVDLPPDTLLESTTSHTIPEVADIEYRVEYEYEAPQQGDFSGSDSRSFSLIDADLVVVVDCTVPDKATVGEPVAVTATVENGNGVAVDATAKITFGDATEEVSLTIPAEGETVEVEAEFVPEEAGDVSPEVSLALE